MPKGEKMETSQEAFEVSCMVHEIATTLYGEAVDINNKPASETMMHVQLILTAFIQVGIARYAGVMLKTSDHMERDENDPPDTKEAAALSVMKNTLMIVAQTLCGVSAQTHNIDAVADYVEKLSKDIMLEFSRYVQVPAQTH